MSWQLLVTVFTFGGLGAIVRGSVIFILAMPAVFVFPLPTLIINILAALLGGFILSITLPEQISATLSVGLIGGMGTLSAFTGDILNHYFDKRHRKKMFMVIASYVMLTTISGVLFAALGSTLGNFVQESYHEKSDAAIFLEQSRALQEALRHDAYMHDHGTELNQEAQPQDNDKVNENHPQSNLDDTYNYSMPEHDALKIIDELSSPKNVTE